MIFSKKSCNVAVEHYGIYRLVETAPWEQESEVITLEFLQKVIRKHLRKSLPSVL